MKLLLDTHALLWWLGDDRRLGSKARDMIADPTNRVMVSAVTLWEIAVKVRVGKLEADIADIVEAVARDGFILLGIGPTHLRALAGLPFHEDHRDPFDHLLVAQAISEGATFLSEDRHTPRYPVAFVTCSEPPQMPVVP